MLPILGSDSGLCLDRLDLPELSVDLGPIEFCFNCYKVIRLQQQVALVSIRLQGWSSWPGRESLLGRDSGDGHSWVVMVYNIRKYKSVPRPLVMGSIRGDHGVGASSSERCTACGQWYRTREVQA